MKMTSVQFAALADLLGLHAGSASAEALRLVLCDGVSQTEAARITGASRPSLTRLIGSARRKADAAATLLGVPAISL